MTTITEQLDCKKLVYVVKQEDGDERVVCTTCSRQKVNGLDTFVFRSATMAILMDPSCFITDDLRYEARNTASQAASALKTLESFCEIIETPFEAFGIDHARAYLQFLRGTLGGGVVYRFELITQRSEGTVGAYLKHIRRYARWLGVSNSPFLQSKRLMSFGKSRVGGRGTEAHRLKADTKTPADAPRYISTDEYLRILKVIEGSWSIEERCIVRLMFEHGLRIGEVLGLTTEDLEWSSDPDGIPQYAVILRNRASDKDFQHAKTLMSVTDKRQYRSTEYGKRNVGMQRVFLSEDLFFQLSEYAEGFLGNESADYDCTADSVVGGEDNRYLFVNTKGRPLSSNLWNKRLRRIMEDAGVSVDKESRKTNLNHRFRHGYAMFLTKTARTNGKPLDAFAVMTLMRHRSILSTDAYLRPTQEDISRLQGEIVEAWKEELYGHPGA
ncbi:MAG: tyrosine-type recombinase/integrase [Atopobiaceae bacterium]|nr:tyrosine-type recombinase/integrase [Atopobiaceae bacterium]